MARPSATYRSARRNLAKREKLVWRSLRRFARARGTPILVQMPAAYRGAT